MEESTFVDDGGSVARDQGRSRIGGIKAKRLLHTPNLSVTWTKDCYGREGDRALSLSHGSEHGPIAVQQRAPRGGNGLTQTGNKVTVEGPLSVGNALARRYDGNLFGNALSAILPLRIERKGVRMLQIQTEVTPL